ncbi:probable G-protein coupled receptor 139 [Rhincodon typus]|uniref:probable G-protein coupled receptor 139 n=1 Tax=Rhincodon typus TaxID=259920 RepID=UPI002030BDFB|nr:probable G-protein coupled receptor 139 [Rhincodon typus]
MRQPVIIQIESIYYPILAIVGVPANVVTLVILSRGRCELSKCITQYLLAMAAADLAFLIFDVILYEINDSHFPYSVLNYTPACRLILTLNFASVHCSVWLTVAFTFDRFVAICCQNLRTKYCTSKTSIVIITAVCLLGSLQSVPFYFIYMPRDIVDNLPWSCAVKTSFYTLPIWIAFLWVEVFFTPFLPFSLILFLNVLTIKYIVQANRVRRGLLRIGSAKKDKDPEIVNRRKSMILLLAISGNFIILWFVNFVSYVYSQFTDTQFLEANFNDPFTILEQTGYILRTISCCVNTFIYAVSPRKFREEFKNMIKCPPTVLVKLLK